MLNNTDTIKYRAIPDRNLSGILRQFIDFVQIVDQYVWPSLIIHIQGGDRHIGRFI